MKNEKQWAAMTSALSVVVVLAGVACSSPAWASTVAPGERSQPSTNRNLERLIKSTFETPDSSVNRGAPARRLGGGSRYADSLPGTADIP